MPPDFFSQTIASRPELPINYIITPKNACSTIKASLRGSAPRLMGAADFKSQFTQWHWEFDALYCRGAIDVGKPFFCVTRNPYDRILSAYHDKVGPDGDRNVWLPFCQQHGLDCSSKPTLFEFLEILANCDAPNTLEHHFCPQYFVNNAFFISPAFTGRVEELSSTAEFLSSYGISWVECRPHVTFARAKRGDMHREHISLIKKIYDIDFRYYGYDSDPRSDYTPPSVFQTQAVSIQMGSSERY